MHVFRYRYRGLVVPGGYILPLLLVITFFMVVVFPSQPSLYWSIRFTLGPVAGCGLWALATWARYPTAIEVDDETVAFRYLGGHHIVVPRSDVFFRAPREKVVEGMIRSRWLHDDFVVALWQLDNRDEFVEFVSRTSSMARSPRPR